MKAFLTLVLTLSSFCLSAQINLLKKANDNVKNLIRTEASLSESDIKKGLSEALRKGSEYAVKNASQYNGFNTNALIRIPFPAEAENVKNSLSKIGLQAQINSFEESMNHAAESASKEALSLLVKAVNGMTIKDAYSILKGADNAATNYLKEQTHSDIYRSFKPIINTSMQKHKVAQQWTTISTRYNALPFTKDINPDLEDYITKKAIDGLFVLLAKQEKEIRKNPLARTSDILKKVFD
jgi:hypothetical protein